MKTKQTCQGVVSGGRKFALVAGVVCFALVAGAATWSGAGDGTSWGDPANWGGALPGASEAVSIATGSSALTINLGATDRECAAITITGSSKLTISGTGALKFTSLTTSVATDVNVPVTLKTGNNSLTVKTTLDFYEDVTALGTKTVTMYTLNNQRSGRINFHKTFTGTGTTVTMTMGDTGGRENTPVHFYGVLTAAKLLCGRGYKNGYCYLHASNNIIGYVDVAYSSLICDAANVFPDDLCLTWSDYYSENSADLQSYDFRGHDQVAGGVTNSWTRERDECRYLRSTAGPMTLTLKGRGNCAANCYVNEGVSVVWDPTGDYTQEFSAKQSTTDGGITVNRGTVKIAGTAKFASLTAITLAASANFHLASDQTGALAGLLTLDVASGATMKIEATSINPFANCVLNMRIADGGVVDTDAAATVSRVVYKDVLVAAGTYGAGATPADWVTGSGTVTVLGGQEASKLDRYWTGAGDGVSWSDDANWDAKAPVSQDTAFFTNSVTITDDILIDGPRPINVASGKTVTLSGNISGAPDITKLGAGELVLTGSNSFTGTLFINAGRVTARGENALGDNAIGAIDVSKRNDPVAYNLVLGGVTVRKELIIRNLDDGSNSYKNQLQIEDNTVNTLVGHLRLPNSYLRMYTGANAKFVIAGGASFNTSSFYNMGSGAEVIVTNVPTTQKIYGDTATVGWLTWAVAGNTYTQYNGDHNRGMQNHVRATVNGAFTSGSYFYLGSPGLLDLCGTTQSISRIEAMTKSASDWTPIASGVITSGPPALVTFNAASVYTNSAIYTGAVSLEQAGSGTVFLTAASSTTGDLIASAGQIVMKPGAKWNGRIVVNGGVLDVPGPEAFGMDTSLALKAGTLTLPAGEYCFASVTDANGDAVAPGRYSSEASGDVRALEGLDGPAVVVVLPPSGGEAATYVWTGAGDGRFSSAANWEGGVLPDFASGTGTYLFPGNGFTATVDTNVIAKGFVFSSGVADTARLVSAGGEVMFGNGTLVVTSATAVAKSVVLDVPVCVAQGLGIRVGGLTDTATRNMSLVFTNRLTSVGEVVISKEGLGPVYVFGNDNNVYGDIVATNGLFYVSGADPLGGSGTFRYYQRPGMGDYSLVVLNNAVVTRDVVCNQTEDRRTLTTVANTTNLVLGKASNVGGHFRITPASNSQITFAGGMAPGNFLIMQPETGGSCVISNTPVVSDKCYWTDAENATINVLACPGNSFTGGETWHVSNTLELRVDNAIRSDNTVKFCMWGNKVPLYGKLDLTDTAQELARSFRTVSTNADGTVKYLSAGQVSGLSGSSLKLSGSQTVQILPVFTGAASYIHAGTGTRYLRNACTSTGELSVVSGTLVMEPPGAAYYGVAQPTSIMDGGSWAGPKVTLAGGTVQVNHAKAFDRHASLYVPYGSAGVINLASGVEQKMGYLYLEDANGVWQRQNLGKWGSAASSARNKAAFFSGTGVMNFLGDGLGTMLIFR
ncbi:MAG: autotransporter-associated beta strand repeat-containing protein [Kiritimatiellae bacterium]|nr:autotransporter-associated beta strand repeat-containing protein [Kiritimatiellia bacterium]